MLRGAGRGVLGLVVFLAACTGSSSTPPATAPDVTTTVPPATATPAPAATTAPTTLAPTTTIDRVAEIEAIFADLEFRRLDALFREDEEAFRALFTSPGYLEESLPALGQLEFLEEPSPTAVVVEVEELILDDAQCIVGRIRLDVSATLPAEPRTVSLVITPTQNGWGYSFGGDEWLCDGPHPLDG